MSLPAQRGFSLLELSIATALGAIVFALAVQLLLGIQQSYRLTSAQARLYENARAAAELVSAQVRAAGALPCAPSALQNLSSQTNPPELLAIARPTKPAPLRGDVLKVRYWITLPDGDEPAAGSTAIAATQSGEDCVIFPASGDTDTPVIFADSPSLSVPAHVQFYVDQSVGDTALSSLFRARSVRGGQREELVEGVYDFRVTFGMDQTGDGAINAFIAADEVNDWAAVYAVRLWLLVDSLKPVMRWENRVRDKVWPDGTALEFDGSPIAPDRRLYRVFATTIAVERRLP